MSENTPEPYPSTQQPYTNSKSVPQGHQENGSTSARTTSSTLQSSKSTNNQSPSPSKHEHGQETGTHSTTTPASATSPTAPRSKSKGETGFEEDEENTNVDSSEYPEQLHAGHLDGVGPEYEKMYQATMTDRIKGFKEKVKGTIKHDPELKEKGEMRMSGELKRREREEDERKGPFGDAGSKSQSTPTNPNKNTT